MACVCQNAGCVFYLLVLIMLTILSAQVESKSQNNIVEKFEAVPDSSVEGKLGEVYHQRSDDELSLPSSPDTSDVSDKNDEGDDEEEEEDKGEQIRVEFTAFIAKRHGPYQARCRRHQPVVKFDTSTSTAHLYNLHTHTFTAPHDGLYTFSIKFQLRQQLQQQDVHIVTNKGKTVICSISSKNGDTPEFSAGTDAFTAKILDKSDDQAELLSVTWDAEAEMRMLRRTVEWDKAPHSAWETNPRTHDVEGFCEGVKHLGQGQQVFVRHGSLDDDKNESGNNDDNGGGDDNEGNVGLCDVISAFFSGSLLTRDI